LNTPFLAESSTGTVRFVQCIAEAEPMKAAAATAKDERVMMDFEFNDRFTHKRCIW
jgi:hypothetical protein